MSTLSAPLIWEPLNECETQVAASGFVPGAMVDIFATPPGAVSPTRIGGGVSYYTGGQTFGVDPTLMVGGAILYATQTFSGTTSPPSPHATLQVALGVNSPRLTAPLLECAACMNVDGMIPGATAEVSNGAGIAGSASAYGGAVGVGLSPALVAGQAITARQVYCGAPGPESDALMVTPVQEGELFLPPPIVPDPLYACQQYLIISGCRPGSQVDFFVNNLVSGGSCSPGTSVAFWPAGSLSPNTTISARQQFCGGKIQSGMSASVPVHPASDIPQPAIRGILYEGDTSVVVAMTVSGEVVTITLNDGTQIGMGGAGGGDAPLNVDPPLSYGQSVVATVELCGVKKTSLPVWVRRRPTTIRAPKVSMPINACGVLVYVEDCLLGAIVRVYASLGGKSVLISHPVKTFSTSIPVGVTPLLQTGWQITATQEVGGMTSPPSNTVVVQPVLGGLPPMKLRTPIFACSSCVYAEAVLPGARVDVYQNGMWIGGADAWTTAVDVEVYPPLMAGAMLTATQTLCGNVSPSVMEMVSTGPEVLPTPVIRPAFAGPSFVTVDNLVPGATVEISEASTYNLVIGTACATQNAESVWLSLPLFAGAVLRARQRLCISSRNSPDIIVGEPPEWPLGNGPFMAGFRLVKNISISPELIGYSSWAQCFPDSNPLATPPSMQNSAIIFYPSTVEGASTPIAAGGPFPLIVFGHAKRFPVSCEPLCPGTPANAADFTQDFHQLSGILAHLARWGFVSIAPDLSWVALDAGNYREKLLGDALTYMQSENIRGGAPFQGQIKPTIGIMGHSAGGFASIYLATSGTFSIAALGLIAPADPNMTAQTQIGKFAPKPVLVLHGTNDTSNWGSSGHDLSIYAAALPTKHLVTISGANHFGYTDSVCIVSDTATISQLDQQKIAKAYLTAFFRRYLSGATEEDNYLQGIREVETLEPFNIDVQYS